MNGAAFCLVVGGLSIACSVGEGPSPSGAYRARRIDARWASESLRLQGTPTTVVEEIVAPRLTVGDGDPEMAEAPGHEESGPTLRGPEAVATAGANDTPIPVRFPWPEDGDPPSSDVRPQRVEPPDRVVSAAAGSGDAGALRPCCSTPCGVSARSLAALMANPRIAGAGVDPLTTLAGRSALLSASRVGATLGSGGALTAGAGLRGGLGGAGRIAATRAR